MGTRNLTVVVVDGETKVAQYGQWDGYPSVAGAQILAALKRAQEEDFDDFKEKVRSTFFISDREVERRWEADNSCPQLERNMGYKIIDYLMDNGPGQELQNSITFAADSLFCEYAYVVDLDANKLEVYKGFNKEPLAPQERFASLFSRQNQAHRASEDLYHPVRLWHTFDLNNLPSEETFLATLSEDAEDETEMTENAPPVSRIKV